MKMPSFDEFLDSLDMQKVMYDIKAKLSPTYKDPSFTEDQNLFIFEMITAISAALLQQYHQWLAEQLSL